VESEFEELTDEELVGRLRSATIALSGTRPLVGGSAAEDEIDDADTDELEWPPIR
jgi:hypothetical protein